MLTLMNSDMPPSATSSATVAKRPVYSGMAIGCAFLLLGLRIFLGTPQGHHLIDQLFARHYTAGPVLLLGFYGAIGLALGLLGLIFVIIAFIRRESPHWLPFLAIALNALAAVVVLSHLRGG